MTHSVKPLSLRSLAQIMGFVLLLMSSSFFFSTHALAASAQSQQAQSTPTYYTVTPATTNDILVNPGGCPS